MSVPSRTRVEWFRRIGQARKGIATPPSETLLFLHRVSKTRFVNCSHVSPGLVVLFHARARARKSDTHFTTVFYGLEKICCKTAQIGETLRTSSWMRVTLRDTLRNVAKNSAKTR
jgi:hypothetical protein